MSKSMSELQKALGINSGKQRWPKKGSQEAQKVGTGPWIDSTLTPLPRPLSAPFFHNYLSQSNEPLSPLSIDAPTLSRVCWKSKTEAGVTRHLLASYALQYSLKFLRTSAGTETEEAGAYFSSQMACIPAINNPHGALLRLVVPDLISQLESANVVRIKPCRSTMLLFHNKMELYRFQEENLCISEFAWL